MRRFRRRAFFALVACFLAFGGGSEARADSPDTILNTGGIVVGGSAQAGNPNSYDFVPFNPPHPTGERSAKVYAFVPGFTYLAAGVTIKVPSAQIYHAIDGSGTWISHERATCTAPARICNYRMDYQNRDLHGNIV